MIARVAAMTGVATANRTRSHSGLWTNSAAEIEETSVTSELRKTD